VRKSVNRERTAFSICQSKTHKKPTEHRYICPPIQDKRTSKGGENRLTICEVGGRRVVCRLVCLRDVWCAWCERAVCVGCLLMVRCAWLAVCAARISVCLASGRRRVAAKPAGPVGGRVPPAHENPRHPRSRHSRSDTEHAHRTRVSAWLPCTRHVGGASLVRHRCRRPAGSRSALRAGER
jgi:hypothetical protein